jgi:hypothetical protein
MTELSTKAWSQTRNDLSTVAYRADPQRFPKCEQKAALLGVGIGGSRSDRGGGLGSFGTRTGILLAHGG